jgi:hypothetical protein
MCAWLVAAMFRMDGQACQHEHENLSRQCTAKCLGFIIAM